MKKKNKNIYKIDVWSDYALRTFKALPWCGGATVTHRSDGITIYYTIYLKPRNFIEKIVTNYMIESIDGAFRSSMAA